MPPFSSNAGFHIITATHLRPLAEHFIAQLRADPLPPQTEEIIVVQSLGMRRWLTLEIARNLGVCASTAMPFPKRFCQQLLTRAQLTSSRDQELWDRLPLTWRISRHLNTCGHAAADTPFHQYLNDDTDGVKRFQLAQRIADTFDNYQLYRHHWLTAWNRNENPVAGSFHASWQAAMWRMLTHEVHSSHFSQSMERFIEQLEHGPFPQLPHRLTVFGANTLPPLVVRMLHAMSQHISVRIYALFPSSETGEMHLLRKTMGKVHRDYESLLRAEGTTPHTSVSIDWEPLVETAPPSNRLLQALQSQIAGHLPLPTAPAERIPVSVDDDSLQIHECHSRLREMEVLRDAILDALAKDASLDPSQIMVCMPDVEPYVAAIQATFGNEARKPCIPFSIADQPLGGSDSMARVVMDLMTVLRGRLTVPECLGLLEAPCICRRFDFAPKDLPVFRQWLKKSQVRWALDATHRRQQFAMPGEDEHTWRFGLDRLLMGFACGHTDTAVAELLPVGGATTHHAQLLGRFWLFFQHLGQAARSIHGERTLYAWVQWTQTLLHDMVAVGTHEERISLEQVHGILSRLMDTAEVTRQNEPFSASVFTEQLRAQFAEDTSGAGFLDGRLTFCALKPMRTIPFRMLCIAGLDQTQFPRQAMPPGFDLMTHFPETGDRQIRTDDRAVFLESLLAAQERLVLSFVAHSAKDHSPIAPSIVIRELLEALDQAFVRDDGQSIEKHVIRQHALHAFHEKYVAAADPRYFSYSHHVGRQAEAVLGEPSPPPPFFFGFSSSDLESPLNADDLVEFWIHPCKSVCRHRLQLRLPEGSDTAFDTEPLQLSGLEAYKTREQTLSRLRRNLESQAKTCLTYSGTFMPGALSAIQCRRTMDSMQEAAAAVKEHEPLRQQWLEIAVGEHTLRGLITDISSEVRVLQRPAKIYPKDKIRAWIWHLIMNAASVQGDETLPRETLLVGLDDAGTHKQTIKTVRMKPVDEPEQLLIPMIEAYAAAPVIPFFCQTSHAYANDYIHAKKHENAHRKGMNKALGQWVSSPPVHTGEGDDPYHQLCFHDHDPLADEMFPIHALAFWVPVFNHTR